MGDRTGQDGGGKVGKHNQVAGEEQGRDREEDRKERERVHSEQEPVKAQATQQMGGNAAAAGWR